MVVVSESEKKLMEVIRKVKRASVEEIAKLSGMSVEGVNAIINLLAEKGLIKITERKLYRVELTDEGKRRLEEFPEEKLIKKIKEMGGRAKLKDLVEALGDDAKIGLGWAKRRGWVKVEGGEVVLVKEGEAEERKILKEIANKVLSEIDDKVKGLERRKMIRVEPVKIKEVEVTERGLREELILEIGKLTKELIESGKWREVRLKEYNVEAEPPRVDFGRLHFLEEFLDELRDVMRSLGFKEFEGPIIEIEFWNFDALFQAQDHPAREVHDTFWLLKPSEGELPKEFVERVREVHERFWGYSWREDVAKRRILRTQTTAVSVRVLANHKPPIRAFTIGKVFRPDTIDATHLPEFYQLDGIVAEEGVSFKDLLAILKEILARIGIRRVRFKPAYFPFTEPSVEGYAYLPGRGWTEVFGAGMLRPQVTEPLGVNVPVAAWGLGIDRLAMALYGIEDIRKLYSRDVEWLRFAPIRWRA